jgi:hypothetical protein
MTDTKPTLPKLVEPLATVYDAYDTGCDWHCRYPPAVGAKIYDQSAIDSLQSALQVAQQERQWVGLTDEELLELSKDAWGTDKLHIGRSDHTGFYIDFGRAVEAKLKEKNG